MSWTRLVVAAFCGVAVTAVAAQQPRDLRRPVQKGAASIGGLILSENDDRPLRRARVTVSGNDLDFSRAAITDESGQYVFPDLPPGRYVVSAAKDGYVTTSAGARRPGRPGAGVNAIAGRLQRVDVRLPRTAVITGRLLDASGEPAAGVTMVAMTPRFLPTVGERRLVAAGITTVTTDDRGVYRIFGLPPGDYFVVAQPRGSVAGAPGAIVEVLSEADVRAALGEVRRPLTSPRPGIQSPPPPSPPRAQPSVSLLMAPVYFPGTPIASRAVPVTLASGEVRTGIDFDLEYVPSATVEGVVGGQGGAGRVQVSLANADRSVSTEAVRSTSVGEDGRFSFRNVPPGHYIVSARVINSATRDASGWPSVSQWGSADVIVSGGEVAAVAIPLQAPLTIGGELRFESASGHAPQLGSMRLPPLQSLNMSYGSPVMLPPIAVEGSRFALTGVLPGTYRFAAPPRGVRSAIGTWWLKSVLVNGRELLDAEVDLRQNTDDAVITFTDRASELSGSIRYANGDPMTDEWIVVFSRDPRHWFHHSRRVVGTRPSPAGNFSLRNLPAGDYLIAVTRELDANEWMDPEALKELAAGAERVILKDGESRKVDLVLQR